MRNESETTEDRAREAYRALDLLSSGHTPGESDLADAPLIEDWAFAYAGGANEGALAEALGAIKDECI